MVYQRIDAIRMLPILQQRLDGRWRGGNSSRFLEDHDLVALLQKLLQSLVIFMYLLQDLISLRPA